MADTRTPPAHAAEHAVVELNEQATTVPRLTVMIPTRDEQEGLPLLLQALGPAFAGLGAELLLVDDSDDATPAVATAEASQCAMPVRLLHRGPGTRVGGLAGAVLAGARRVRGQWVLVMDADLQHPVNAAATVARTAMGHDVDIVIGTRRAGSGSSGGLEGPSRHLASCGCTALAKVLFPRSLATVSDPMSGLFAFRLDAVDLDRLDPLGFKVLLEILVRHPAARVAEVAYRFAPRAAGSSKASLHEGVTFLRHLVRLRLGLSPQSTRGDPATGRRLSPGGGERLSPFARFLAFGLIGLTGIAVNTAALWFGHSVLGIQHLLAAVLATEVSTGWNFALLEGLVYRGGTPGHRLRRAAGFFALNNVLLLGRLPALELLVRLGVGLLVANVITLVVLFLLRFFVSDLVIYRRGGRGAATRGRRDPVHVFVDAGHESRDAEKPGSGKTPVTPVAQSTAKRPRHLPHRYDIDGVVAIGSQVPLPELEFFRAQWVPSSSCDITLRVGAVGHRTPRHRASMTELPVDGEPDHTTVVYEEQLGQLGANFHVEMGRPISVVVSPLLARSPHVVYTNVIEALLRFVLVSHGRMLLHSACVELDGTGVMLSALTDTGKTATVLRLLREHGGRFLSDDMTLVTADGVAQCFPKPLTISSHTLHAVHADDLTRHEWRRLQRQSRLHSKGGRSFALTLSRFNLPIMAINALVQFAVPPPKFAVDRLIPCRLCSATPVRELFIIERGAPRLAVLGHEEAEQRLLANTEDAYGFPPFRYFAPAISLDGMDYTGLRSREREILSGFLDHVRVRVLASDHFTWADDIPRLLTEEGVTGPPAPGRYPDSEQWPHWGQPDLTTADSASSDGKGTG
ncbi:glycosyltransferase [Streptomyces sp. T028]|uniref:glycosyltransferase n=1 Tax=Streptomyces sp. T028 TaxID=3394379 RepID=UPI003A8612DB